MIKKRDLVFIIIKSFFIDTLWNFRKFQNVGFLYVILPAIKRLYPKGIKRALAMKRHIKYFNTHPYMANSIIGVVVNTEEKKSSNNGNSIEIDKLKFNMMGPFAALGDSFFSSTWKPFLVLVLVAFMFTTSNISMMVFACVFFLIFFNIPHLFVRIVGFIEGYRKGFEVIQEIRQLDIQGLVTKIKFVGIIFLGTLLAVVFLEYKIEIMGFKILTNFLLIGVTFIYAVLLNLRISTTVVFAMTLIISVVLSYLM